MLLNDIKLSTTLLPYICDDFTYLTYKHRNKL